MNANSHSQHKSGVLEAAFLRYIENYSFAGTAIICTPSKAPFCPSIAAPPSTAPSSPPTVHFFTIFSAASITAFLSRQAAPPTEPSLLLGFVLSFSGLERGQG